MTCSARSEGKSSCRMGVVGACLQVGSAMVGESTQVGEGNGRLSQVVGQLVGADRGSTRQWL